MQHDLFSNMLRRIRFKTSSIYKKIKQLTNFDRKFIDLGNYVEKKRINITVCYYYMFVD